MSLADRLRRKIAWSVIGQVTYIFAQFAILILLTRFASVEDVGRFGLSTAIIAPTFFFFQFGLRYNIATDSQGSFTLPDFLTLRLVSTLAGLAVIALVAVFTINDARTLSILGLFGLAKAVEMQSDLTYGVFEKHGALRWVAESLIMRGVSSTVIFALILASGGAVTLAFLTYSVTWLIVFLAYDLPRARRLEGRPNRKSTASDLWRLAWETAPLGASGLFAHLSASAPRLLLASFVGLEQLGYYTSIAYVYQGANMMIQSINHAVIGRLARYWADGDRASFWSVMLRVSLAISAVSLVGAAIAIPLGRPILGIVFGSDYAEYDTLLVLMIVALAANAPLAVYQIGLMAQRRFMAQFWNRLTLAILVVVLCLITIPAFGLNGAAIALAIAGIVQMPITAVLLRRAEAAPAIKRDDRSDDA